MEFMAIVIPADPGVEAGKMPDLETMKRMGEFNQELTDAGVLMGLNGLHPSSTGTRLSFKGGKVIATDGPFIESRELIGGYWIWNVKSKEEALYWAKRAPMNDGDLIELRQIWDQADFALAMEEGGQTA